MKHFNCGDLESIFEILTRTLTKNCILHMHTLRKSYEGIEEIMYLLRLLFECFPDGHFFLSDASIDNQLQVRILFRFIGTFIFHINSPENEIFDDPNLSFLNNTNASSTSRRNSTPKSNSNNDNSNNCGISSILTAAKMSTNYSSLARSMTLNKQRIQAIQDIFVSYDELVYSSKDLLKIEKPDEVSIRGKIRLQFNNIGLIESISLYWDAGEDNQTTKE